MPRYFFPATDGVRVIPDQGGTTLPDAFAAHREALSIAADLLAPSEGEPEQDWTDWRILVLDESGHIIWEVPVRPEAKRP
jgi:hypothetical protein